MDKTEKYFLSLPQQQSKSKSYQIKLSSDSLNCTMVIVENVLSSLENLWFK